MQVTINVPDNLPQAVIQQKIKEFELKLQQLQGSGKEKAVFDDEFKIDELACLDALAKIKRGDKSGITEIGNVKDYIENLKHEIS